LGYAQQIATDYAVKRQAFGKALIDHAGAGFMLADNMIKLQQAKLMLELAPRRSGWGRRPTWWRVRVGRYMRPKIGDKREGIGEGILIRIAWLIDGACSGTCCGLLGSRHR
jgi:alkylation response protein AidB-like acyl-CoA dehydrogenase